jgi:hypothetical protein
VEKYGVVKTGVTPELDLPETKTAADCVKANIVDNKNQTIDVLDADFRKKAADAAAAKLNR